MTEHLALPTEVVEAFLGAFAAMDFDTALSFLSDDVEYTNIPLGAMHGHTGVRQVFEVQDGASDLCGRLTPPTKSGGEQAESQQDHVACGAATKAVERSHCRVVMAQTVPSDQTRPAITLIVVAMIATLKRNDRSAWRSTVARIAGSVMLVSDTWNVMPTVNPRYAKSR